MTLLDGRKLRDTLLEKVKGEIARLSFQPIFTDIVVGDNAASLQYARMKKKTALSLGCGYEDAFFGNDATPEEVIAKIRELNQLPHMAGIIVQLPLPEHFPTQEILDAIDPRLDVDVLGTLATEKFYRGESSLILPTAHAVMKFLDEAHVDFAHASIVVIGRGVLVGKPVAYLLEQKGVSPHIISRSTGDEEKARLLREADVIISAAGSPKIVTGDMVKDGVVVIDAGTSEMSGSVVGDVDFDSVEQKASYLTPSPGGVGPVTVACLFENVMASARDSSVL